MKKTIMFIGQCALIVLTGQAQIPTDNPLKTTTDSLIQEAVLHFFKDPCRVGLSMAMYNKGTVTFYNYGSISKEKQQLPTRNNLYEIGSITKTFTGTLLAKAIVEKKMKLDDDIRLYFTETYPNLSYKEKYITLRHLSTHQSGLPNSIPDNSALFKKPNFDSLPFQLIKLETGYDRKRYLQELHHVTLDTIPGSIYFKYSNIGMKLMSFALENVYRQSYSEMIKRFVTGPLKMNSTSISLTKKDSARLVKGYNPNGKPMPYILENVGAAGGLKSSTNDMVKYVAWHLQEKDPVIRQAHEIMEGDIKTYARGLNWQINLTKEDDRKLWQSGGSFGMSSQLVIFPDSQVGFILLANDACFETQGELEKIAIIVFNGLKVK